MIQCCCRYLDILENMEGRVQRYYYKREPRQLIPRLVPNEGLNSIVLSENRCRHCSQRTTAEWSNSRIPPAIATLCQRHLESCQPPTF